MKRLSAARLKASMSVELMDVSIFSLYIIIMMISMLIMGFTHSQSLVNTANKYYFDSKTSVITGTPEYVALYSLLDRFYNGEIGNIDLLSAPKTSEEVIRIVYKDYKSGYQKYLGTAVLPKIDIPVSELNEYRFKTLQLRENKLTEGEDQNEKAQRVNDGFYTLYPRGSSSADNVAG